jgi:hypothetical protein
MFAFIYNFVFEIKHLQTKVQFNMFFVSKLIYAVIYTEAEF